MNANSLFKVLVLGGAMLTAGATRAEEVEHVVEDVIVELAQVLCMPVVPQSCELNAEGKSVVKEGLVCCWATTCDTGE